MLDRLRRLSPGTPTWRIVVYEVGRFFTDALFVLVFRFRQFGAERVPRRGPVLLVANHQSFLDPPLIGAAVRGRHIDYVARAGLFSSPLFRALIVTLNALPIREDGGDAAAIREILRRLGEGRAVLIFPEGSRTPDGAMHAFKRGVAVIVKRARCPVVPVAIEGAFDAWPRHRRFPSPLGRRIALMFGEPIGHDELMAGGADAAMDRLFAQIQSMRLRLRRWMREQTDGRYPRPGPGDSAAAGPEE